MSRTVIIDGDIVAYRASEASMDDMEVELEDEDNNFLYRVVTYGNKKQAEDIVKTMINKICDKTHSDKVVIALSSSTNFRKEINPEYKINRKKVIKPLLLNYIKEYIKKLGYKVYEREGLEADDIIGILATSKDIKGDKCVWSLDKDFKTIPCKFAKGTIGGKLEKKIISENEADWWFMYQTLKGDPIDGYKGCPKVGDKTAIKLLGEIGEKSLEEMWKIVKDEYIKQGLTKEDALMNARMARILRASDYDFKQKKIKLWEMDEIKDAG